MASVRWLAAGAFLLAAGPAFGAGFGIFEQGSKAMGMAGAFTAQADDPSLLWHNAGGLAFVNSSAGSIGATWIHSTKADFQGANPYPGAGVREEEKTLSAFPPHAYWVSPINQTWKWGIGIESPFGLVTEWKNPNTFSGRFISTKAQLDALDVNPTIGWQITPNFGLGVGAIARFSKVELDRHVPFVNPYGITPGTPAVFDVGSLKLESDGWNHAYGWNVGILHKVTPQLSWGASYRSSITVDYTGKARISQISTGIPAIDAVLRTQVPYDTNLPVKTAIDFPDMLSLGVAYAFTPEWLAEFDINRTGWSQFKEVPITFTGSAAGVLPNQTIPEKWNNVYNYRIGARWTTGPTTQVRFGYVRDNTPQPEEAINPLLPDANRNGFTVGYGSNGKGFNWDVALMYLKFQERTRNSTRMTNGVPQPGESIYYGTYNTTAWLLGLTLGWK
jgi:long-chain fatty acid transport protein